MMKTFDERFTAIYPRITALADRFARTTSVPSEEYESYLCEAFINIDSSFNPKVNDSYMAYVGTMLESKAKHLANKASRTRQFYDTITPMEVPDSDDEDAKYPLELVADVDIEQEVFDVMFIEEQLAKADDVTRRILRAFFDDPNASYRDIAKIAGVERKMVQRRLKAVAEAVRAS